MVMQYGLDAQLHSLIRKERAGAALPLSLRRFAQCVGHAEATAAMQTAAARLLDAYSVDAAAEGVQQRQISVNRLGKVAGANVVVPSRMAHPRRAYSTGAPKARPSHTGELVFSGGAPRITVRPGADRLTARVSVAHEIGHLLIHRRADGWDSATVRLPSSSEEEALAEYAARLLLMPGELLAEVEECTNLAEFVLRVVSAAGVTVHAAVARLGDPDIIDNGVRGAILWRLNSRVGREASVAERLTPHWHLCPGAFVPIGRCAARVGSLAGRLASDGNAPSSGSQIEDVRIGSFAGRFLAQGCSWGTLDECTRLVLTVYRSPESELIGSARAGVA